MVRRHAEAWIVDGAPHAWFGGAKRILHRSEGARTRRRRWCDSSSKAARIPSERDRSGGPPWHYIAPDGLHRPLAGRPRLPHQFRASMPGTDLRPAIPRPLRPEHSQTKAIMTNASTPPEHDAARRWVQVLAAYREPSLRRSLFELGVSLVPFAALWALAWWLLSISPWLAAGIAVLNGGFLVRLFAIQHDCGHGAFFRQRWLNDALGRLLGVLTLTPYDVWKRTHSIHHSIAGNLDRRDIGDIETLTVREYLALSPLGRLRYRLYRHPLVLFGLGPSYHFLLKNRLPLGLMRSGWRYWASAMGTNAAIAAVVGAIVAFGGWMPLVFIYLPTTLVAASIGMWLFYVQHQFEETHWDECRGLAAPRRGAARKLALRAAAGPAMAVGQYRRASRASPLQPHSLLPVAGGPAGSPRAGRGAAADAEGEPVVRQVPSLGREDAKARVVLRGAGRLTCTRREDRTARDEHLDGARPSPSLQAKLSARSPSAEPAGGASPCRLPRSGRSRKG
jgi:acyl-lipid omega-6 desaturase (Delta-12 desaturase)